MDSHFVWGAGKRGGSNDTLLEININSHSLSPLSPLIMFILYIVNCGAKKLYVSFIKLINFIPDFYDMAAYI